MSKEEPKLDFLLATGAAGDYEALCKWFDDFGFFIPPESYCEDQISINLEEQFYTMLN